MSFSTIVILFCLKIEAQNWKIIEAFSYLGVVLKKRIFFLILTTKITIKSLLN